MNRTFPSDFLPKSVKKKFPEVTQVRDATKPLRIQLTTRDSQLAIAKDPVKCAMARACVRQEHVDGAVIRLRNAYIIEGKTATRYDVPESVRREIVVFDRFKQFAKGEYQLNPPVPSRQLGSKKKKKSDVKRKPGIKKTLKVFRHYSAGVR